MSSSNSSYCNYAAFKPLEQQKKSRFIAGLLLAVVVVLHSALAWYLLSTPKIELKKPLIVMEVAMLAKPEPVLKAAAKEPPPAPPPVKKEPIKPKAVVKPPPVKKPLVVKKPAPLPDVKETVPVPKFEPVPMVSPAPAAVSPAPSASSSSHATAKTTTTGQGQDDSKTVVSGVVPLLRVPPKYPARAATRHIEGWVTVEFTIQTDGTVGDAIVISAEPEGIFDEAALTAIGKWEFKEKMVNGVAVTQRAVQRLQFKLEH